MNSSLRTANNLTKVLVAKGAASHGLADGVSVAAGLADGVVAVVKPDMTITNVTGELTNSYIAAGGLFHIVQGTGVGNALLVSPLLKSGSFTVTRSKYKAATNQVTYVGYNGTSGAIDADALNTSYVVTLVMTNPNEKDRSQPTRVYGQYTSPVSGASHEASALGLALNLAKNFSTKVDDEVLVERVCSGTGIAVATGADTHVFTKGSTTVVVDNVDDATGTDAWAVGDYVRVGTANTDPVYGIVAIDTTANTLTLDMAFQGEDVSLEDTEIKRVDVAALGNFGLKLSGKTRLYSTKYSNYYRTRFSVSLGAAFLGTGTTTAVKAFEGIGVPQQVDKDYHESMGFYGQVETLGVPPVSRRSVPTALTGQYGVLHLSIANPVASIVSQSELKSNLIVYLEYSDGTTGGTAGDVSANGEEIISTSTAYDA